MKKNTSHHIDDNTSKKSIPAFPIEVFPEIYQTLAKEAFTSFGYPYEFMAGGFLFVTSTLIGNSYRIIIKTGWEESAMLWLIQVGGPGSMKTPPLKMTLKPLKKIDMLKYNEYNQQRDYYNTLSKKDKDQINEPTMERHVFNDFTIEALIRRHTENQFGIGINKNELASWFGNMNQYKSNSNEQAMWISIWDGDQTDIDTISRGFGVIDMPHIPIIGGIQPVILQGYLSNGTSTFNGFSDRLLYLYSEAPLQSLNNNQIDSTILNKYNEVITLFEKKMKSVYIKNKMAPEYIHYSKEANERMLKIDSELIEKINSKIAESDKQYLSKLRTYFHRIALNLELLNNSNNLKLPKSISLDTVIKTKKLIDYFYESYLLISSKTSVIEELNNLLGTMKSKTKKQKSIALLDKDFSVKDIALILKSSEQTIRNYKSQSKHNQ